MQQSFIVKTKVLIHRPKILFVRLFCGFGMKYRIGVRKHERIFKHLHFEVRWHDVNESSTTTLDLPKPVELPLEGSGICHSQNMPLWHEDYFRLFIVLFDLGFVWFFSQVRKNIFLFNISLACLIIFIYLNFLKWSIADNITLVSTQWLNWHYAVLITTVATYYLSPYTTITIALTISPVLYFYPPDIRSATESLYLPLRMITLKKKKMTDTGGKALTMENLSFYKGHLFIREISLSTVVSLSVSGKRE